jgi:hypothetical protein
MREYPVKVGSMLFTLVDPHPGFEVAYNRWYERDHFYAGCMIGPWLFAGGRWVATRALKELRFPQAASFARPVDAGSYLSIYWVHAGHHDEHFKWASDQVHWLYSNGRGFAERSHVHTALYDYRGSVYRDADPVPVELALDHGYAGLAVAVLERAEAASDAALDEFLAREALPGLLAGSPIAMATSWTPHTTEGSPTRSAPMDLGSSPGGPERRLQMFFLDRPPASKGLWPRFRRYARSVERSRLARPLWLAPFLATDVGTDRYTDQLW